MGEVINMPQRPEVNPFIEKPESAEVVQFPDRTEPSPELKGEELMAAADQEHFGATSVEPINPQVNGEHPPTPDDFKWAKEQGINPEDPYQTLVELPLAPTEQVAATETADEVIQHEADTTVTTEGPIVTAGEQAAPAASTVLPQPVAPEQAVAPAIAAPEAPVTEQQPAQPEPQPEAAKTADEVAL
jgi:hypothetical protein